MAEKENVTTVTITRMNVELHTHIRLILMEESMIEGSGITIQAFRKPFP